MALGDPYAQLAELKARLNPMNDTTDDAALERALGTASRSIERYCRRQFHDAGLASARTYRPTGPALAIVDDFSTTTGLVVQTDDSYDGSFATTWSTSDYDLEPEDGIMHGVPGWPWWKVRAVDTRAFPRYRARRTARVTARWGWTAVPEPVHEACLILAEDVFKLKDSPFKSGGFSEFGRIHARDNPHVVILLKDYRRDAVRVR